MSKPLTVTLKTPIGRRFNASDYILGEDLKNAIEVAIALNQPLLLTGEPGTGKTKLAYKIAYDLSKENKKNFLDKPIVFNTKTSSAAKDLFYTYDALSHFQQSNIKSEGIENTPKSTTANFIELQALGKAIAQTNPSALDTGKFNTELLSQPMSSVVLIDEIDKAPRDFTNDILNEIDEYYFQIKEQDGYRIEKSEEEQIIVIMTSNSEKNLPDAFLRRCVFYNIPFPADRLLMDIVQSQLGVDTKFTEEALNFLIQKFEDIRGKSVRKKPATAELVSWLKILGVNDYMAKNEEGKKSLILQNLSILVKTQEDLKEVKKLF